MTESLSIAERLRTERQRLGLKQDELSAHGGVSRVTQGKYERGEGNPDAAYLAAIYHFAGADVGYILTGIRSIALPRSVESSQLGTAEDGQAYSVLDEAALREATMRVFAILAERDVQPNDPMKIGPIRDFVCMLQLTDEQTRLLFDLLEQAPDIYGGA